MSLISRIEVTNYLTEGLGSHRRVANWNPMLTGITLRMDGGRSALVNLTNGGGKTSLVEVLLYLLSRHHKLLARIREKASPKSVGYTHARIEFRSVPEDSYSAPSLLDVDPNLQHGETHVLGVALSDDVNDPPIFYSYAGVLEDSPCYYNNGKSIISVPDAEFINRTRSLPGCKWNKFSSKKEWEDHVGLFLSIEVVRRNVTYQLKGSDDKNASFFDFKPRGGESYDSAFFRSVVAPDLLTNLLGSFAEEDELSVEDTLHKSLSGIVSAEREVARKERHLEIRQSGIDRLQPILDVGQEVEAKKSRRDESLRGLHKDVALIRHFGAQGLLSTLPGLPKSLQSLQKIENLDARVIQALRGMVITPDEGILILAKHFANLAGVDVAKLNERADRKQIQAYQARSQVIDFSCDLVQLRAGGQGGGYAMKGYCREAALALSGFLSGISSARVNGLEQALSLAFDIAEAQIDTNPASIELRRLDSACRTAKKAIEAARQKSAGLTAEISGIESQIKDKQENQGAWEDFVKIGSLLPENLRESPSDAKTWLDQRITELKNEIQSRILRKGTLLSAWDNYTNSIERAGLEGLDGIKKRYETLVHDQTVFTADCHRLKTGQADAQESVNKANREIDPAYRQVQTSNDALGRFEEKHEGYQKFRKIFGDVHPQDVDPEKYCLNAENALKAKKQECDDARNDLTSLERLKSQGCTFEAIFGQGTNPLTYDPDEEDRRWAAIESEARQGMASLAEKVEDLAAFEAANPGVAPSAWLKNADARRADLLARQTDVLERKEALASEEPVIQQICHIGPKFVVIFGKETDPLTYNPDEEDRRWAAIESVARQGMASLAEKVEDLATFEAANPGKTPLAWLKDADARRSDLLARQAAVLWNRDSAVCEVQAIEQMRTVEDGAFGKAWDLIEQSGIPACRLHEVMLSDNNTSIGLRTDALSALSGILAAPVFDKIEHLEAAAEILSTEGVSVPILHKEALLQAINTGISSHGDLRLFGFIGGSYSRRVRILLEPAYAQSELERLRLEIVECEQVLQQIENDLPPVLQTSDAYTLALRAADATSIGARGQFDTYKANADDAAAQRNTLRPQLTGEAREVLRIAEDFLRAISAPLLTLIDRKRILLEPTYAQSEHELLRLEIVECEQVLQQIENDLPPVLQTSDAYTLALRAADATSIGARGQFDTYKANADDAAAQRNTLRPQLTKEAGEVLRSRADFTRRGGETGLTEIRQLSERLTSELHGLQEALDVAKNLAAPENLIARQLAFQYLALGGISAHDAAATAAKNAELALEVVNARYEEASELVERLTEEFNAAQARLEEFRNARHPEEMSELAQAIAFADSHEDMEFMQCFIEKQAELEKQDSRLLASMSVNFERAIAFKEHQNESDQQMQTRFAKKKLERQIEEDLISKNSQLVEHYQQVEIPRWQKLSRTVHELAWEVGRRAALTRSAAVAVAGLEEGGAAVEAHPLYQQISEVVNNLKSAKPSALVNVTDLLNDAIGSIQGLDLEDGIGKLRSDEAEYQKALLTFNNLKDSFCTESREGSASMDRAFNALEIEEIEKASPERMKVLGDLFIRLKATLEKDRADANRAKAVAEDANKDSLNQLSGLIRVAQDNLAVLEKVMARYPDGRFFVKAEIAGEDRIKEILHDLKEEVERANLEQKTSGHTLRRTDETRIKQVLRNILIDRVFMEPEVQFINAGIWKGRLGERNHVTDKLSTGQKIALEFMWIIRQAEYEIERGLRELTSKQAARSRDRTNRMIMIDGIFSTLSDRHIIKEALNGLRGLGGNFQIIGFLHSQTWVNDYTVFPIYHVGKKLTNSAGNGLISFSEEGRANGSVGFFSSIARPAMPGDSENA